ncbi:MAG: UDP-2,3-diacylglucosamine diphosphatase [Bacteroidota bacterium]
MKKNKRKIDLLVLSDTHLGTIGCRASELSAYLKTIKPATVILNGDIIDGWQFNKRYFPKSHIRIIKQILGWLSKGTRVYYITGNHDEVMRRFKGFQLGGLKIVNQLKFRKDGKSYWFFHGDVFDVVMKY